MREKGWIQALMELSVLAAGNPAANDRLTTAEVIEKNDDVRAQNKATQPCTFTGQGHKLF